MAAPRFRLRSLFAVVVLAIGLSGCGYNTIPTDEEAAKANPFFGGRVAHGYLILSFAAGLFVDPAPGPVPEPGAPPGPALVRGLSHWACGDWPGNYEAQVRAAYMGNPVAQRAVRIVAEGAGGLPVYAEDDAQDAAAALVAACGLVETVAAQLLLHGNAYLQIACDLDGMPVALYALIMGWARWARRRSRPNSSSG